MTVIPGSVVASSEGFASNREAMLAHVAELGRLLAEAVAGGGEEYVARHRSRGKLLARERIDRLVDPDSPFLELSPIAGATTEFPVGGGVVTGIGVVSDVACMIVASDPTVRGGAVNPIGLAKGLRAQEIAAENRLPLVNLVESGGADLPNQAEIFVPGGATFRNLTRLSAAGIPTIAIVFGNSTAGGAYLPGMSDHVVMIRRSSKVFLAGPPLVKMATGEDADEEALGGAAMHAAVSGSADYLAEDEDDAVRVGREVVAALAFRRQGPGPTRPVVEPMYPADELLGIVSADLRVPFPVRQVLGRLVDGSELTEFKSHYGVNLVTGWAHLHGFPIGILANDAGILFSEESQKAAQFIQLANRQEIPLLFVQNVTGYMVGERYEQGGMIKHGALMINAVANSTVPHLTLQIGGSYGAGNYGMCGRAFGPRFLFVWPNARTAVMGADQLAGVVSMVSRASAQARGIDYDEEADAARTSAITAQIEHESAAAYTSGRLLDDGVIDPRHTRDMLGMALWAIHSAPISGAIGYGVFRM
jgi:acetyl-CoA carboxylase carboxyltransferase component